MVVLSRIPTALCLLVVCHGCGREPLTTTAATTAGATSAGETSESTTDAVMTTTEVSSTSVGTGTQTTGETTQDTTSETTGETGETTASATDTDSDSDGELAPGECRAHKECDEQAGEICWEATPACPTCQQPEVSCTSHDECEAIEPGWRCHEIETPCVCGHWQIGHACGPPCSEQEGCPPEDLFCLPDNSCGSISGCGCAFDDDCDGDLICVNEGFDCGLCVPSCMSDGDCQSGHCVNRRCRENYGQCVVPNP